jgi:hypothetical protein
MTLIPDLQRDLVVAAERLNRRSRVRLWARPAAGLAAVGIAIATVVIVAPQRDEPGPPSGAGTVPAQGPRQTPTPSPDSGTPRRPDVHPDPLRNGESYRFEFAGTAYSMVGFRSGGSICTTLIDRTPEAMPIGGGRSCLSQPLLSRAMRERHVHIFSGGGGKHTFVVGFARADVVVISLLGSYEGTRVVLSDPWRPDPGQGEPIRFFYVISDTPPYSADGESPVLRGVRGRARLASGEVVEFSS